MISFGLHAAFKAAFPWFDDYRWGWHFERCGQLRGKVSAMMDDNLMFEAL